jgi:magnesium chelatase subunit D
LSYAALAYGVQGHRVDLFAVYAACAAAALDLRDTVDDDDLTLAMRLTILPRATQLPVPPPAAPPPPQPEPAPPPPPPEAEPEEPAGSSEPDAADEELPPEEEEEQEEEQPPSALSLAPPEEQIFQALAGELPDDLEELPFRTVRRGRSGSRGATAGRRGRHVRSLPGDPRQMRIDVSATLRSAAPWQPLRRQAQPVPAVSDRTLFFEPSDIRVKHFRSKAGALFCFGVDASGSMALHRMRQAKGAVHVLLEKAYVKRDRVALLAFRGQEAELLMPPTQSVELARRALDLLPTGGGTPLASALLLAATVAQQARTRGIYQTVLILLTDGRANVALQKGNDIQGELQQIAHYVVNSGLHVLVVDTQRSYLSRGEARQLAEWLGGDYVYLPNASGEAIAAVAAEQVK